jgi:hypothetical protein
MIPQTPRHDFLHELHKLLRPATYLEIGVQTGRGMAQAIGGSPECTHQTIAIGVDPNPQVTVPIQAHHTIYRQTSDEFFAGVGGPRHAPYDLAFIDGMHLVEYALRDFIGVERHARPDGRTVAVFDDVLPYSADIAGREPLLGDWAGDVWKIISILDEYRTDLTLIPVSVQPTGALVVLGLDPQADSVLHERRAEIEEQWARDFDPVATALAIAYESRSAVGPAAALQQIRTHLNITEA